ncbi:ovaries absent isoform X2 [Calliopsis andreniformis]|uniref:ovaries absent isoform X2 n=1 Tax=Calliopsis andreniformis TaxID=337506 RepID=UPI003FCD8601
MRYSTVQEQEYGVGLPQNQLLLDTNTTKMNIPDNVESKKSPLEEGSVVSNLPLLFANGYPTSLEKITVTQLERFVTFMVQCSLGHDTGGIITEPQWWPKEVKFSNPLTRPKRVPENWMANLKKLVFRCYTYHRCEYLLRFCSYLARYPHEDLEYVNNWDSTTSLFHKNTGKLLVTFRNENMNYDKRNESPRKKLLTRNSTASCYSNKLKQEHHSIQMVEPPIEDIYLCDNCDAEFVGLGKMKGHTKCNSQSAISDLPNAEPELQQDQFLEYFRLCSRNSESKSVTTNNGVTANSNDERSSRRVRSSINFTRFSTIPFSSPAGMLLSKKSKTITEETQQERLERTERHLIAPVLNESSRPKWLEAEFNNDKWVVTYKPNRDKSVDDYVHQYKFVNSSNRKPMLSIHAQLLHVICRPVYVLVTRLTPEEINSFKQDSQKSRGMIQKVSVDNEESATKYSEKLKPYICSKRKAPCDETDGNVAEISEKLINGNTTAEDSIFFKVIDSCDKTNTISSKLIEEKTLCPKLSDTITMIDLCSSDEEASSHTTVSSDENRDPMNQIAGEMTKSLLEKLSSTKLHVKSHICPTDQTGDWLSDNILSDNSENYTNKYHSTMLKTHTKLSPILRPAS